jgi:hypothetical protein
MQTKLNSNIPPCNIPQLIEQLKTSPSNAILHTIASLAQDSMNIPEIIKHEGFQVIFSLLDNHATKKLTYALIATLLAHITTQEIPINIEQYIIDNIATDDKYELSAMTKALVNLSAHGDFDISYIANHLAVLFNIYQLAEDHDTRINIMIIFCNIAMHSRILENNLRLYIGNGLSRFIINAPEDQLTRNLCSVAICNLIITLDTATPESQKMLNNFLRIINILDLKRILAADYIQKRLAALVEKLISILELAQENSVQIAITNILVHIHTLNESYINNLSLDKINIILSMCLLKNPSHHSIIFFDKLLSLKAIDETFDHACMQSNNTTSPSYSNSSSSLNSSISLKRSLSKSSIFSDKITEEKYESQRILKQRGLDAG